jgi:hypothetical protein
MLIAWRRGIRHRAVSGDPTNGFRAPDMAVFSQQVGFFRFAGADSSDCVGTCSAVVWLPSTGTIRLPVKLTSTRDVRPNDLHHEFRRTLVAGFFRAQARRPWSASRFISRLVAAVYFAVALATPVLILAGPEVMPPPARAIADKALDGKLARELHWPHP